MDFIKWLDNLLRSAFEDSIRSIISSIFVAVFGYGVTRLWRNSKNSLSKPTFIFSCLIVFVALSFCLIFFYIKLTPNSLVKIKTVSLQQGRVGEKYNSTLTAEIDGIVKKVDWSTTSLPAGLRLSGEMIEGTPQIAGQYEITVIASDGNISDSRVLSLVIKGKSESTVPPSPNIEPINIKPNEEIINAQGGQNIYRIHFDSPGRLALQWQTGERESSKVVYVANLRKNKHDGETIVEYSMTSTGSYKINSPVFVSSGDYYLTLLPKIPKAIPYSITLQFESMEYIEIEENDAFSSATLINNNIAYSGNLKDKNDKDYYCFRLINPGAVNVTINTTGNGADTAIYTITVYDANRSKLTETTANGKISFSETGNLYLRTGTYYVSIKQGNAWNGGTYGLTINTSIKDFTEAERNDTADTANIIPINEDIHASIMRENDIDYFSFILEKSATVTPYFDFSHLASDLKIYTLIITNSQGKEIIAFDFRGNGQPSRPIKSVQLEAGTYIIRVLRIKRTDLPFTLHEYVLRIDAQTIK